MVPVRRVAPEIPSVAVAEDAAFDVPAEPRPRVRRTRARKQEPQKLDTARRSTRFDEFDDFSREIELEMPYDPGAIAARASAPRRVRGSMRLPDATWARWTLGVSAAAVLGGAVVGGVAVRNFFRTDPRFRIASSDAVVVTGNKQVSADEIRAVFAEDIGRNIFFVPLDARREQLRAMPWVHLATVERLFPDHVGVQIEERVPTAFIQNKGAIELVDADGVVMDMPSATGTRYSFPVLSGLDEDVPQAERAVRIAAYERFITEINSGGKNVSDRISEMDMSDPEDVVATLPSGNTQYTVHFGDEHFLDRWKMYESHLPDWQSQYPKLASMDLRNAPQVTLGMSKGTALSDADALAAAAAEDVAAAKTPSVDSKPAAPQAKVATAQVKPVAAHVPAAPVAVAALSAKPKAPAVAAGAVRSKAAPATVSNSARPAAVKPSAKPALVTASAKAPAALGAHAPAQPPVNTKPVAAKPVTVPRTVTVTTQPPAPSKAASASQKSAAQKMSLHVRTEQGQ